MLRSDSLGQAACQLNNNHVDAQGELGQHRAFVGQFESRRARMEVQFEPKGNRFFLFSAQG